jgi:hypothetical protein
MLINKGYSAGDIVCFKVVTGDEIVAKIVDITADGYVVSRPCTVLPSPQGLALMQSIISADINNNNVTLNKQHIVMTAPVVKDIENHYIKTTTGIETVNKGGIIR